MDVCGMTLRHLGMQLWSRGKDGSCFLLSQLFPSSLGPRSSRSRASGVSTGLFLVQILAHRRMAFWFCHLGSGPGDLLGPWLCSVEGLRDTAAGKPQGFLIRGRWENAAG